MNEDDRLDLGALDPGRDATRWRGVVEGTLARVDAVLEERARRQDPLTLIASWTRPLLAAAAMALVVLVPVEIALELREARVEKVDRLVDLSADWARRGRQPTPEDLLRVLGEDGRP